MAKEVVLKTTSLSRRFFHSSIESACRQLDEQIEVYCQGGAKPGWKDRVLAGVVMQAFLNESFLNAVGVQVIEGWSKDSSAKDRLKKIRNQLLPDLDANKPPYSVVDELRHLRNQLAHQLPEIDQRPVISHKKARLDAQDEDEGAILDRLGHSLENQISLERYRSFRDQSALFRQMVQNASGLRHWDLISTRQEEETVLSHKDE